MFLRVLADHQRSYEHPIIGRAGDGVKLCRPDADAPGWTWCTHDRTGRAGWTPDAYLARTADPSVAFLTCNYDATELTVQIGDRVRPSYSIAGWTWCLDSDGGEGWVPEGKLGPQDEP